MKTRPSLCSLSPFGQPSYWTASSHRPRGSTRKTRPNGMSTQYRLPLRSNDGPSRKLSTAAPWRFGSDHSVRRFRRKPAGSDENVRAVMRWTLWNGLCMPRGSSLHGDLRVGHHLGPAREVGLDERRELVRRARDRNQPLVEELLAHVGQLHDGVDLLVELGDD